MGRGSVRVSWGRGSACELCGVVFVSCGVEVVFVSSGEG